ncbi:diacylglycerol kinase [Helicobacter sp. MIT 11-5569]|uniref:diacylglycerol kinase n=1 Tax=Helicobacter sp. MIT 11-5569 TaxID=1548151 RepID=UPI00051FA9E5|nr:diacylglycerol kinase [Helicobacter sp. MIT 11-5569]TLD83525.1 diacylglycerol kinase [Helicobacter sp. MIT 11-5569]
MKPKYYFFANAKFALEGVLAMLKREVAFRIELAFIIPAMVISFFLPVDLSVHLFLIAVLFLILILEAVNSSIEACVDLITSEFAPLAKIAKDCASAAVFFSILLALLVWGVVLFSLL